MSSSAPTRSTNDANHAGVRSRHVRTPSVMDNFLPPQSPSVEEPVMRESCFMQREYGATAPVPTTATNSTTTHALPVGVSVSMGSDEDGERYNTPDWDERSALLGGQRPRVVYSEDVEEEEENETRSSRSGSAANVGVAVSLPGVGADYSDEDYYEDEDPVYQKSVYMLGCSILMITSVVFVIIVSGLTTLLSRRSIPRFEVYSDWPNGGVIPAKYGCRAPGGIRAAQSFPLHWLNVPATATNLVILFANPGSINAKGIDPVHWFVTDIPVRSSTGVIESIPANASKNFQAMPKGAVQRVNYMHKSGEYYPPCPRNSSSLFVMHVYAVDASPVIDDYRDAREIMNRFVGVPTATFSGSYGHMDLDVELGKNAPKHGSHGPVLDGRGDRHQGTGAAGDVEQQAQGSAYGAQHTQSADYMFQATAAAAAAARAWWKALWDTRLA